MSYRLYVDTSVFGALFDEEDQERVKRNDARHIALATVADLDALVSWNFRDMVNLKKKSIVHSVNAKFGYRLIDIISPLEVPRE